MNDLIPITTRFLSQALIACLLLTPGLLHAMPASAYIGTVPGEEIPYPDPNPDPRCNTNWMLLWHFNSEKYCDGGHFWQFFCMINLYNHDRLIASTCTSSIKLEYLYFPLVFK